MKLTTNGFDQIKCYVTGKEHTEAYYFGSTDHVNLLLSQDAFAHFIIRAGKDTVHQQIMADLKAKDDQIRALKEEYRSGFTSTDQYIDAAIQVNIFADEYQKLITQKAESGIRILRKMRDDFQKTGKLSS